MVNPRNPLTPSVAFDKGNPLSPYLFILCMEYLSSLPCKDERNGNIKGVKIAQNAPMISHLFFADDPAFFLKGTTDNCKMFANIMDIYCKASGQIINQEKLLLLVSSNTPPELA